MGKYVTGWCLQESGRSLCGGAGPCRGDGRSSNDGDAGHTPSSSPGSHPAPPAPAPTARRHGREPRRAELGCSLAWGAACPPAWRVSVRQKTARAARRSAQPRAPPAGLLVPQSPIPSPVWRQGSPRLVSSFRFECVRVPAHCQSALGSAVPLARSPTSAAFQHDGMRGGAGNAEGA